jgi:hypothetical protein
MRVSYKKILIISGGIILTLSMISGCLFQQNRKYEMQNRDLIIQNDSIMSVNIELKNFLKRENAPPIKASSTSFKEENKR